MNEKQTSKLLIMFYLTNTLKVLLKLNMNLKKVQSPSTNIVVHDLETFNKIRAVPNCSCIYKLSTNSGKNH